MINRMKLEVKAANTLREIRDFINERQISKDNIVSLMQHKDGTFSVTYFVEE